MMRKSMAIFVLVFLMILSLKTSVLAQDEIQKYITMFKDVSPSGERFAIEFGLLGEALKDVNRISIIVPKGKRMQFNNRLNFNNFLLSSDNMTFGEFSHRFPEGEYKIDLTPRHYGRFKILMIYNFPNPVITYPVDGATDVPTDLTIQWEPLSNITNLWLTIRTAHVELGSSLPVDATSFTVYQDLEPNTFHEISLQATTTDFEGNALVSTHTISFTTVAQ